MFFAFNQCNFKQYKNGTFLYLFDLLKRYFCLILTVYDFVQGYKNNQKFFKNNVYWYTAIRWVWFTKIVFKTQHCIFKFLLSIIANDFTLIIVFIRNYSGKLGYTYFYLPVFVIYITAPRSFNIIFLLFFNFH